MNWRAISCTLLTTCFASSCATKQVELDLSEYPNLPSAPIVHVTRAVLNTNSFTRSRAFWGNYVNCHTCAVVKSRTPL